MPQRIVGDWCEVRSPRRRSNYADSFGSSSAAPTPARNETAQMRTLRRSRARAAKRDEKSHHVAGDSVEESEDDEEEQFRFLLSQKKRLATLRRSESLLISHRTMLSSKRLPQCFPKLPRKPMGNRLLSGRPKLSSPLPSNDSAR